MHILILGNGFDLYHGLKTSYLDFLKIVQNLDSFNQDAEYYLDGKDDWGNNHIFKDYFEGLPDNNKKDVYKIYSLLRDNIWSVYYGKCNANIQGWIDFENEMNPVLNLFRNVFTDGIGINDKDKYYRNATYLAKSFKEVAVANILNKFFEDCGGAIYSINEEFIDESYGLLKDKILDALENDLDNFTLAFTIYLRAFVESRSINKYDWIENINPDRILSFNYTKTERFYFPNIPIESCAHFHGTTEYNNIVFGTDYIEDSDKDFMHFSKWFQRLTKVQDFSHINFLDEPCDFTDLFVGGEGDDFEVSFIGCSLDKNDAAIFEDYIKSADQINIYCYGFSDFKKALRNLINIFGSKFIGNLEREHKISFFDIKKLGKSEVPKEIEPREYYRVSSMTDVDD